MFYDYLDSLCAEKGLTVTELMKELDLSPSSASRWKNRGYKPSRVAAKKIADYFGITVTELLSGGNRQKKISPPIYSMRLKGKKREAVKPLLNLYQSIR